MTKEKAIEVLDNYQSWSKGDDKKPYPNMIEVGVAIDTVLGVVKKHSHLQNVMHCGLSASQINLLNKIIGVHLSLSDTKDNWLSIQKWLNKQLELTDRLNREARSV